MTIKFYASPISTCSKRVAVVLKETNTPYEFISIDIMKGEQKAPDFVAKQPFGQVPYIVRRPRASPARSPR
jgi:glutathione S-transferase